MIVAFCGKLGSGKDVCGRIIQYLTSTRQYEKSFIEWEKITQTTGRWYAGYSDWMIMKFADSLKDMVCVLLSCTRDDLENRVFKDTPLGIEWNKWKVQGSYPESNLINYYSTEEEAKFSITIDGENFMTFEPTIEEIEMTPRLLMQLLGTECGRNIIHPDLWVLSLFRKYQPIYVGEWNEGDEPEFNFPDKYKYPNWCITDVRFPNEVKRIQSKGGIVIRLERHNDNPSDHYSETALDNFNGFDYIIDNNGTIEELFEKVKEILILEKILNKE